MASWRYILHPNLRQMYVPVARLPEEQTWRRVCVKSYIDDVEKPYMVNLENFLCNEFFDQLEELNKVNVSFSEVWLVQEKKFRRRRRRRWGIADETVASLDHIVEGSCSQFGRTQLHVDCLDYKRSKCILSILRKTRLKSSCKAIRYLKFTRKFHCQKSVGT